MREIIWLKAWFWRQLLGAALGWCWLMRFLHRHADNLCGWLARKCEGRPRQDEPGNPGGFPLFGPN